MIVAVSFFGAAAASALLWLGLSPALTNDRFLKQNFRGTLISGIGGVPLVIVSTIGSMVLLMAIGPEDLVSEVGFGGFQLAVGFGVLGLLDDLGRQPGGGGFKGHLSALRRGKVTTGLIKLAGGAVLALLVAALVSRSDAVGIFRDAVLIAAAANLANLFDRAPGRSVKVTGVVFAAMLVAGGFEATLAPAALGLGGAIGLLGWELRERMMLGDTGVNVLGALAALGAVATFDDAGLWVATGVVVLLNVASEFVSFSKVINAVGVLRSLDGLGRRDDYSP